MKIGILDFDSSLISQKRLLLEYSPRIINLKDLSSSARLWMGKKTADSIQGRIKELSGGINFLGSGDFHHVSSLFTSQINEPVSLIVFDLHPDWDILPPYIGCGSWVSLSLKNKNIVKCILVGVSSCDIQFPYIQSGNLKLLKNDRVEVYPYKARPSFVFLRRVPDNRSIHSKKGVISTRIFWHEIIQYELKTFFTSVIERIPTKKVYVSIDKDCLKNDYSLTNWEEGFFSLDQLLIMLKLIKNKFDIHGVDITGDYSKPLYQSWFKRAASSFDHPFEVKAESMQQENVSVINEESNLKILSVLNS